MPPVPRTTQKSGSRFYTWRDANFWSVTTIINGGIPKPALIYWSANQVAEFVRDNYERGAGLAATDRDAAYDLLKRAPWRKKEKAADIGSLVHEWIEADRLEKPMPKVPEQVEPYLVSFRRFVEDFSPEYEAAEASVFNRKERYAGTLDAVVSLQLPLTTERQRFVLDAKSGKGVYPEVGLQLAAYRHAEFIGAPDGSEQPMPETVGALALHLTPEGYRLIEVDSGDAVFASFLYAREVYRFQLEISKTVLGAEYGSAASPVTKLEGVA